MLLWIKYGDHCAIYPHFSLFDEGLHSQTIFKQNKNQGTGYKHIMFKLAEVQNTAQTFILKTSNIVELLVLFTKYCSDKISMQLLEVSGHKKSSYEFT